MKGHVIINRLTIQTLSNIQASPIYTRTHTHARTQYMQTRLCTQKAKLSTVRRRVAVAALASRRVASLPAKTQNANKQRKRKRSAAQLPLCPRCKKNKKMKTRKK